MINLDRDLFHFNQFYFIGLSSISRLSLWTSLLLLLPLILSLLSNSLEHWTVFKHIWQNDKSHLTTSNKDLLVSYLLAISLGDIDIVESHVHCVFGVGQVSTVELTRFQFNSDNMLLGFVQQLYWYSNWHLLFLLF